MPVSSTPFDILDRTLEIYSQKELAEEMGVDTSTIRRWRGGASIRSIYVDRMKNLIHVGETGNQNARFRFIDLFAGIGGLRKPWDELGGACVFTSEWNRFAVETYRANFPSDHEIAGDITKVDPASIPDHDLLLAGFPCQPFSLAGVVKKESLGLKHGFLDETQGTLFFNVAKIIQEKQPVAFLLENVKNLISHDRGRTFEVIMKTLSGLGYDFIEHRIIDAKYFVPQHRERTFIVGFKKNTGFHWDDFLYPTREGNMPTLADILHPEDGSEEPEPPYTEGSKAKVARKYILTDHLWNYLQAYAEKHRLKGNGFGCSVVGTADRARTLSARYHKDGSEILIRRGRGNPRRLTPRECARLMGFDSGDSSFVIPVSDTQAYRQFGNAVVVPVVREIARIMEPHLMRNITLRTQKGGDSRAGMQMELLPAV